MGDLVLIARGVGGASAELSLPGSTTFRALQENLNTRLNLRLGPDELEERLRILTGFPPRAMTLAPGELIGGHVTNKESLKIEVKPDPNAAVVPLVSGKNTKKKPADKKPVAKKAASKSTPKTSAPSSSRSSSSASLSPGIANVHTVRGKSGAPQPKKRRIGEAQHRGIEFVKTILFWTKKN